MKMKIPEHILSQILQAATQGRDLSRNGLDMDLDGVFKELKLYRQLGKKLKKAWATKTVQQNDPKAQEKIQNILGLWKEIEAFFKEELEGSYV